MKVFIYDGRPGRLLKSELDTIRWLEERNISYDLQIMKDCPPTSDELRRMLFFSKDGIKSLVRKDRDLNRSINLEDLPLNTGLFPFLQKNPAVLKRPIILRNNDVYFGYSEEGLRKFLPRKVKKKIFYDNLTRAITEK